MLNSYNKTYNYINKNIIQAYLLGFFFFLIELIFRVRVLE